MRVNGQTASSSPIQRAHASRGIGGAAFALASAQPPSGPVMVARAHDAASLDVILALQDQGARQERRRRSVRRGHAVLDRLEQLRISLLDGAVPAGLLGQLREDLASAGTPDEEPALRAVLAGIDLRAAVEMAKLEVQGSAL